MVILVGLVNFRMFLFKRVRYLINDIVQRVINLNGAFVLLPQTCLTFLFGKPAAMLIMLTFVPWGSVWKGRGNAFLFRQITLPIVNFLLGYVP